jgi:hypothetical protein
MFSVVEHKRSALQGRTIVGKRYRAFEINIAAAAVEENSGQCQKYRYNSGFHNMLETV